MPTQARSTISYTPVTDDLLQDIVRRIVTAFDPEMVILFGSRACGNPGEDSDIDLLVVTNAIETQSVFERHRAISDLFSNRRFALDVLVRTPAELDQLVKQGPAFFKEIITQGKVLYERRRHGLDPKGRSGLSERAHPAPPAQDTSDNICWSCQQSAEKYLKAYLAHCALTSPRSHDLVQLGNLCSSTDPDFNLVAGAIATLDQFGTDIRYPGVSATLQDAQQAFAALKQVRAFVRAKLGLA